MGKLQRTLALLVLMNLWTMPNLLAQNAEHSRFLDALVGWTDNPFWSRDGVVLVQGQTIDFETGFFSPKPLTNVHWAVTKSLEQIFGKTPVFITNYVEPRKIYPLKVTIRIPDDLPSGRYHGLMVIIAHRDQGPDKTKLEPMKTSLGVEFDVVEAPR